jgi:hypothetical protein
MSSLKFKFALSRSIDRSSVEEELRAGVEDRHLACHGRRAFGPPPARGLDIFRYSQAGKPVFHDSLGRRSSKCDARRAAPARF